MRIPPRAHVRMTLNAIHQRRLAQMLPPALRERKLHLLLPSPPLIPIHHSPAQLPHPPGARHALERRVVAHPLEKRHAVPRPQTGGRAEYPVRGRRAHARRERFETLSDGYDEGAREGGAVDPGAGGVEGLQTSMRGHLEEVAGEHTILVGPDALGLRLLVREAEGGHVGVFDDFELVLLVRVEEAVEGCGGQTDGFGD